MEHSKPFFPGRVESLGTSVGAEQPSLPRKRKVPRWIDNGSGDGYFSEMVEEHYRLHYFEAVDLAVQSIKNRFEVPAMRNFEEY